MSVRSTSSVLSTSATSSCVFIVFCSEMICLDLRLSLFALFAFASSRLSLLMLDMRLLTFLACC